MSWIVALSVGAGLGLAYFGGLWLTVLGVLRHPSRAALVPLSGIARLLLLAFGLGDLGPARRGQPRGGPGWTLAVAVVYVARDRRSSPWTVAS